jgi:hypothetical protein
MPVAVHDAGLAADRRGGAAVVEKGHGRIETRTYTASSTVDCTVSDRSYRVEPRFTHIKTMVKIDLLTQYPHQSTTSDTRLDISSAPLDIDRLANVARGRWGGEHALVARRGIQGRSVAYFYHCFDRIVIHGYLTPPRQSHPPRIFSQRRRGHASASRLRVCW